jgi:murein DD-endopeptidase MepM/ murein hydrolase activator NlpD
VAFTVCGTTALAAGSPPQTGGAGPGAPVVEVVVGGVGGGGAPRDRTARSAPPPPPPSPPPTPRAWPVPPPPGRLRPVVLRGWDPPAVPWAAGHRGVDLAAGAGRPVRAAAAGVVSFAGPVAGREVVSVVLEGSGGPPLRTTYEPVRARVRKGDRVAAGQVLGVVQGAGASHCAGRCVHWGLLRGDRYLDPLLLLPAWMRHAGHARLLPVLGVPRAAGAGAVAGSVVLAGAGLRAGLRTGPWAEVRAGLRVSGAVFSGGRRRAGPWSRRRPRSAPGPRLRRVRCGGRRRPRRPGGGWRPAAAGRGRVRAGRR